MSRLAAIVVAVACAFHAAPARPAGPQPDVKVLVERNKQCLRKLSTHVSKVSFGRKDVERYLAEWRSFDALEEERASADATPGPECVDLSAALADPKILAWARERGLDPKDWLLKSMRISLTYAKRTLPARNAEMKAQLEAQRRELAQRCKSMGPNACREIEAAFAQGDEMVRQSSELMALFPDPSPAEAALLDEFAVRLREAVEGGERAMDMAGPPDDEEEQED